MMNWVRTNWSRVSTGLVLAAVVTTGVVGAKSYFSGDCCSPGAACCKPGAPCCHGGGHNPGHV